RVRVKNSDQLQAQMQLQGTSASATASATEKDTSGCCSDHSILQFFNPSALSPRPSGAECLWPGTRAKVEVRGYRRVGVAARHRESFIRVRRGIGAQCRIADRGT